MVERNAASTVGSSSYCSATCAPPYTIHAETSTVVSQGAKNFEFVVLLLKRVEAFLNASKTSA